MLDMLLNQIKQAIFKDPTTPHQQGHDPSGLIGQIEGLFGQHRQQYGGQQYGGNGQVLPASQDPYGDPADQVGGNNYAYADQGLGNVRPASQDPYGDPADQPGGLPNVRPASEDPYGDPADQEYRR
jgi:hypothetical protein